MDVQHLGRIGFDPAWLRRYGLTNPDALSLIAVRGTAMHPTIEDGDEILVDRSDEESRLRAGIYVLSDPDEGLLVRRIVPVTRDGAPAGFIAITDNDADEPAAVILTPTIDPAQVVGRVVWLGRRVRQEPGRG